MGHTHIRLALASEDVLTGALRTAWKLRIDMNAKTSRKKTRSGATHKKRGNRRSWKQEERRTYDTVFVYHNGAESYYASRGFRGSL